MGYDRVGLHITARISKHNDERDLADEMAWDRLKCEIRELLRDYRYNGLDAEMRNE